MTTHTLDTSARHETETKRERSSSRAGPAPLGGVLWFAGWLFTIGYAKLVWWQVLLGLIAWPYFLGAFLR